MAKKILMVQDWIRSFGIDMVERKPKKLVQLACDVENFNSANLKRLPDVGMVFDKLDGVYALIPCIRDTNGVWHVKHFGRSGKELSGCEQLNGDLVANLTEHWSEGIGFSMVLISEITAEGPLAKLSGYLTPTRKVEKDTPPFMQDNFHEMLSLAEFVEGVAPRGAFLRYGCLVDTLRAIDARDPYITMRVMNRKEAKKRFEEYTAQGGEGIIGRIMNAPWVAGQKNEVQWKMKERIDFDCEVIGIATGKKGSKYETVVGKVLVAFRAFGRPDGKLFILPVGSGLLDSEREEFISSPESVLGRITKIKAKSYTEFGNIREPVIDEWRSDKHYSDFPFEKTGRTIKETIAQSDWTYFELKQE